MVKNKRRINNVIFVFMVIMSILFLSPIFIVLINSFKAKFFISDAPFTLPNSSTFAGVKNYINGIEKINFFSAFGYSLFITVASVLVIILFTSMTAWYITRVKNKWTSAIYYLFAFSMVVPFQMVMFTMSKTVNILGMDNPIEEAAMIDGCSPIQTFFLVVFPILRPTAITVAILNAMWIWNDYLLPYLTIGNKYKTIPVAVQYLQGGYGSRDMGALMAMLILAILPIVTFYLFMQKYIIEGVLSGAVKG